MKLNWKLTVCVCSTFMFYWVSVTDGVQPATTQSAGKKQYDAFMAAAAADDRAGDNAKSIEAYRQAIGAAPDEKSEKAATDALALIGTEASEYKSKMAAAKAYERVGEDDKAIETYQSAIVAAADSKGRTAAEDELDKFGTVTSSVFESWIHWILEVLKWPLGAIVALASVFFVFALPVILFGYFRRFFTVMLTVKSFASTIPGHYVAGCIEAAHIDVRQDYQRLYDVNAKVNRLSASSVAPTPLPDTSVLTSTISVTEIEPLALDVDWKTFAWRFHNGLFRSSSASFALEIGAMQPKDAVALVLTLHERKCKCQPWGGWALKKRWYIPLTCTDVSVDLNNALYEVLLATVIQPT